MSKVTAVFKTLFPFTLYLHIIQLERYEIVRSLQWIFKNFTMRKLQNKKPLHYTLKAKAIIALSAIFFILIVGILYFFTNTILAITGGIILIIQPYVLILLAVAFLQPYQMYQRTKMKSQTRAKIASFKKTKVIGIAGSYAKTSVKNILYHLLSKNYKVLKTPLSYNTVYGLARVVDLELDDSYDFFICEMGEFQPNDIMELCQIVHPTYGIITGINDQHLERFGTLQKITATLFELCDYLQEKNGKIVLNFDNNNIYNETLSRHLSIQNFYPYATKAANQALTITNIKLSDMGTSFQLLINNENPIHISTSLLGSAQLNNILGAATMAHVLGMPIPAIAERIKTLPKVPHRWEQTVTHDYLLIDNAYNSNTDGFKESLKILADLPRKNKILVTPGIVELGSESTVIHEVLGQKINEVCSYVIFVGKNERTLSMAKNIDPDKVIFISEVKMFWQTVVNLNLNPQETSILLENDLPDNFN